MNKYLLQKVNKRFKKKRNIGEQYKIRIESFTNLLLKSIFVLDDDNCVNKVSCLNN